MKFKITKIVFLCSLNSISAQADEVMKIFIHDRLNPYLNYRISTSSPISFQKQKILLEALEGCAFDNIKVNDFKNNIPDDKDLNKYLGSSNEEDLLKIIQSVVGEDSEVSVVPIKSMVLSTQETWK